MIASEQCSAGVDDDESAQSACDGGLCDEETKSRDDRNQMMIRSISSRLTVSLVRS